MNRPIRRLMIELSANVVSSAEIAHDDDHDQLDSANLVISLEPN